ncbi:MAG: hypothetical protein GXW90_02950 [Tepidanaerobacter acetatoxydans]|nr:hypothetical protein [Tepidanaerobacter acetatoxydans]
MQVYKSKKCYRYRIVGNLFFYLKEEITQFVQQTLDFLCKKDIELAILACNTATAALDIVVEGKYDFPVLGIIKPGAKEALKATKNKKSVSL